MRAYELDEGFRDWFKPAKKTGPQPLNYADIEMIQSVDKHATSGTHDDQKYNLVSEYELSGAEVRFVYVRYPNGFELRISMMKPNHIVKSFKFRTASDLHKLFHRIMQMLNKNGT